MTHETTLLAAREYDRKVSVYGPEHPLTLSALSTWQQMRAMDEQTISVSAPDWWK